MENDLNIVKYAWPQQKNIETPGFPPVTTISNILNTSQQSHMSLREICVFFPLFTRELPITCAQWPIGFYPGVQLQLMIIITWQNGVTVKWNIVKKVSRFYLYFGLFHILLFLIFSNKVILVFFIIFPTKFCVIQKLALQLCACLMSIQQNLWLGKN